VFVTLEGIDRSGKTTQARMLAEAFGDRALAVREPGGTPLAERIRRLVTDPELKIGPVAETLLFAAARADLAANVIKPALEDGKIVICDRFGDSTTAYQGGARGVGVERVEELNDWASGELEPDLTFLLEIPVDRARWREGERDRFEHEGSELQLRVAAAYEQLVARHPKRFVRVDADRSPEEVHARLKQELEGRLALR
jgi:dTMP kinase